MGALALVWGFLSSGVGRIVGGAVAVVVAGGLCWGWGYLSARDACKDAQAAAQAALLRAELVERARQAKASNVDVAKDREKVEATAGAQAAMQAEIDRLKSELDAAKKEPDHADQPTPKPKTVVVNLCGGDGIDRDFARRVRRLDAAGGRR